MQIRKPVQLYRGHCGWGVDSNIFNHEFFLGLYRFVLLWCNGATIGHEDSLY